MLEFAICDDEPEIAKTISDRIFKFCAYSLPERVEAHVAPVFTCARQVLDYVEHTKIDVIFLDINMPETDGFALAGKLREKLPDIIIVFVSAFDEYVYGSFEYAPFRFIRKNRIDEELPVCIEKIVERYILNKESFELNCVDVIENVKVKNIVYFETVKNYYIVHIAPNDKKLKCRGTMDSVEKMTAGFDFFRIHAAFIINMSNIEHFNDDGTVTLCDGTVLPVSGRRLTKFKQAYFNYIKRRIIQ